MTQSLKQRAYRRNMFCGLLHEVVSKVLLVRTIRSILLRVVQHPYASTASEWFVIKSTTSNNGMLKVQLRLSAVPGTRDHLKLSPAVETQISCYQSTKKNDALTGAAVERMSSAKSARLCICVTCFRRRPSDSDGLLPAGSQTPRHAWHIATSAVLQSADFEQRHFTQFSSQHTFLHGRT